MFAVACASGLTLACIPSFEDDTSRITETRVLGVRAEPAEPAPGAPVRLSVFIATPTNGNSATSKLRVYACTKRPTVTEAGPVDPACLTEFGNDVPQGLEFLGEDEEVTFTVPSNICRIFGPGSPPALPGSNVPGRPLDPDSTGGFYQPIVAGTEFPALSGIRLACGPTSIPQTELIRFNRGYRPNEHPRIDNIQATVDGEEISFDNGELTVPPSSIITFKARWPSCPEKSTCGDGLCTAGENASDCPEDCLNAPRGCEGAETYLFADPVSRTVVPQLEKLIVAWFSDVGSFDLSTTDASPGERRSENTWVAPGSPATGKIWIVLRDDRGGISLEQLDVHVAH